MSEGRTKLTTDTYSVIKLGNSMFRCARPNYRRRWRIHAQLLKQNYRVKLQKESCKRPISRCIFRGVFAVRHTVCRRVRYVILVHDNRTFSRRKSGFNVGFKNAQCNQTLIMQSAKNIPKFVYVFRLTVLKCICFAPPFLKTRRIWRKKSSPLSWHDPIFHFVLTQNNVYML